ncbi:hypothetical protein HDU98_002518 [Podochytrium sp. JEL0797]|nr:hypothetical protein HDU98_002518 [Podochytrium sp. JEL0797]
MYQNTTRHAHIDALSLRACATLCTSAGFSSATTESLYALDHLLTSHLSALASRAKSAQELMARNTPNLADVHSSIPDANLFFEELIEYAFMEDARGETAHLRKADSNDPEVLPHESEEPSVSLDLFLHKEFQAETAKPHRNQQQQQHSKTNPNFPNDPQLPIYPSVHTYKKGEISGQRETDTAKLREIKAMRALEVDANLRRLLLAREILMGDQRDAGGSRGKEAAGLAGAGVGAGDASGFVNYQMQRKASKRRVVSGGGSVAGVGR